MFIAIYSNCAVFIVKIALPYFFIVTHIYNKCNQSSTVCGIQSKFKLNLISNA